MSPDPQSFSAVERRITLTALMIVFSLGALDQTIVSTAMPRIVAELKGLNLYAWVTTGYLLTSTVMVPIWGKLSDLYGRKPVLLAGVGWFLAGSWLSGLSTTMVQLIVFRAVQGVGGGALFTVAFAIIADMYAPRERGRLSGLFGSVFGTASVIGPVIGGFFTEHGSITIAGHLIAGWRWVFYINLPLSALSLFMITVKMPRLTRRGGGPIDFIGAGLIVAAFAPLLLALSLGGQTYPWGSPMIVGLIVFSGIALLAFIYMESRVREPIIPMELFTDRTFSAASGAGFIVSMASIGGITFMPLFMQVGLGAQATASGLAMLPLMAGIISASTICGFLVSHTGRFKPIMLTGGVVLTIGVLSLVFIGPRTGLTGLGWRLLVMGAGLGGCQNLFTMAAQNAAPPHRIGVVTSSCMFFRQIGATIGVALCGAMLTQGLGVELAKRAPRGAGGARPALDIAQLQTLALSRAGSGSAAAGEARTPAMIRATSEAFAVAMSHLFAATLVTLFLALALILLIPPLPMRSRVKAADPVAH